MKIPKKLDKIIGKAVNGVTSAVSQTTDKKSFKKYPPAEGIGKCCREAAAEGIVLLKNNGNILPLKKEERLSLFGRVQRDTFFVGYGSGGDVNAHYTVNYMQGIINCAALTVNERLTETYKSLCKKNPVDNGYWGHWPFCYEELPVSEALCRRAAADSDVAAVFIGRAAGEDRDNTLTKGSFYLTDEEENLIDTVRRRFSRYFVVMNIGGIMDFSWIEKYDVPCVLIAWQGGMEAGNALADVISGKISPSGKLPDTIAKTYEDYPSACHFGNRTKNLYTEDIFVGYRYFETFAPEKVLYPFGYGLTYSDFSLTALSVQKSDTTLYVRLICRNTGNYAGKNTVQLYFSAENTSLPMPAKQLIGYKKTALLSPGESEELQITLPLKTLCAFDDRHNTDTADSWVLQKGNYTVSMGFDCRNTEAVFTFVQEQNDIFEALSEAAAPEEKERLMRLTPLVIDGKTYKTYVPAPTRTADLRKRILDNLPQELPQTLTEPVTLEDVIKGRETAENFVSQLTDTELEAITRGDYIMNSPLGAKGNAGVFGGVLPSLREKGIPPVTCTDGPSGIRLAYSSALLPNGTCLAAAFNPALTEKLYGLLGKEMKERGSHVLLAPGMNIHRDVLCGRNFEYFSEDPLVSGISATAVVKGLQGAGVSACPKHFACNNQETNRIHHNSVLSQRALREIYLRGFEYCVRNAKPYNIMTSYNKINGVWGHYHYDLVTRILKKEWGYEGNVITDWWMRKAPSPEFPEIKNQAYRVRAGVDVLMPGGERIGKKEPDGSIATALSLKNGIKRAELQQSALRVIDFIIKLSKENMSNENHEF